MKLLFVLPILLGLLIPYQSTNSPDESSPLAVVNFKWSRARRNVEAQQYEGTAPARAMIPQNRNFARNARINDPHGVRDPNADTLDGRSAAREKSVQESRTAKPKATDGFAYQIKVQNSAKKAIEVVFWEYQFHDPADTSLVAPQVKASYERVLREQWVPGMCKGL